jgi:plasmid maintenance system antidote protein VapI
MAETNYPLAKAIGEVLKKQVRDEGWTQEKLAHEIGMKLTTLNELLNGVDKKEDTLI